MAVLFLFLSPASGSRPTWSCWRCAGTSATACPTVTSKSSWPNAASRSITPPSTGGCNASPRCPLYQRRRAAVPAQRRRSLVRRWDLREGGRGVAVRVSGSRSAPSGHRYVRVEATQRRSGDRVLRDDVGWPRSARRGHNGLAAQLLRVVDDLLPNVLHVTSQNANNRIERDHGRLDARLRPMRGLRTDRTATVVIRGHAFIQNLRRGHYKRGIEAHLERASQ